MQTKYLYFLLVFTSISLISKAQEIGFPVIRNYTPKEYNNEPQVFSALQDHRGIMYFGIGGGVVEYDGVSWRYLPNGKEAVPYDLELDNSGKIFIAADGEFGYLTADKKGNTVYQSLVGLASDTTPKIGMVLTTKQTSKFVYFHTYKAVLQYSPDTKKLILLELDKDDNFLGDFVFNDIYYLQSIKKGLVKIENNKLELAPHPEFFKQKNVFNTALLYNDTTVLIPTRIDGLYLYQPNKDRAPQKFNITNKDFFVDNDVYCASTFQKDFFVLGSLNQGSLLVDKQGTVLQHYQESNLLQTNQVYEICPDMTQNIWMGLGNGISKTEHGQDLSYWDKNSGLKGGVISVVRYDGTIYIATNARVYFIDKSNQIQGVQNISIGQSWCFLEPNISKSLLVGTQGGIYEIKEGKAIQIWQGSHALKLYQSVKNPYRILSTDDVSFISLKFENNKWNYEGKWKGIDDDIRGIVEDEKGELWFGTYGNGVIRVIPDYTNITKPQKVRYYNKADGFSSLNNILPFKFKNKIIWGTENGLYVYNTNSDRFEPFCGLGEQFCKGKREVYSLIEMPDGKIWISPQENSKADIGYLQPMSNGGYEWVYAPFRRIPLMSIEALYVEPSGVAWIGGSEGVYRYDMSKDTKNYAQKYNCLFRKITVGSDSIIYGGNALGLTDSVNQVELEYEFNSVKFEFAAPFFDQEDKTLYSYKLEGYDKDWSKWGRQTEKEYTNLNENTYKFRVKARNIYDIESESNTYQITILPPFYRTWWAYGIYLVLFGLLVFGIVRLNLRRLQKDKDHLEGIVIQRTAEIVKQKDELQLANATKDKFFGIIAHDLRNPFNLLLGFSDMLIEKIEERDLKASHEFAIIINQSSSVAFELLENLLNWSRSQTGRIAFSPENLDVKALIDTNIILLKSSAENKGILLSSTLNKNLNAFADKNMVLTILRNLITNAIKFSKKDDRITVDVEESDDSTIIHVSDTGVGIDDEIIGKLFKVDEKIKTVGTAKEPGTGLGLILCKEFVDWHKGRIWVESKVGIGSRFSFTLPKASK